MSSIDESIVKESLSSFDSNILEKHFDDILLTRTKLKFFLGLFRRQNDLIMEYPNKKREIKREAYFRFLKTYIEGELGLEAVLIVEKEIELIKLVEHVYRSILGCLGKCDISKLPPNIRVASYIKRTEEQFNIVRIKQDEFIKNHANKKVAINRTLKYDQDDPCTADDAIIALIRVLSNSLLMEAHRNKWFTDDNFVQLPELPEVGDDEVYKAGSNELLAAAWASWKNIEQRCRFLGGKIYRHQGAELSHSLTANIDKCLDVFLFI